RSSGRFATPSSTTTPASSRMPITPRSIRRSELRRSTSSIDSTSLTTTASGYHRRVLTFFLNFIQVLLSIGLIALILMHSGKDAGLSGAFGVGTGAGPLGGGSLVERNLNRWTVFFGIVWVVNTIVLIKIS